MSGSPARSGGPPPWDRWTRTLIALLLGVIGLIGLGEAFGAVFGFPAGSEGSLLVRGSLIAMLALGVFLLLALRARRRRQRLLERARGHVESVMRSQAGALVTTDLRGRFTYVSEAACALLGREASEIVGRPVADVYARGRTEVIEILHALAKSGEVRNRSVDLLRGDGTPVAVDLSITLITDEDGRRAGTLGLAWLRSESAGSAGRGEDIADFAMIRELSSAVAHEVRNPLSGIRGAIQVLRSKGERSPRESAVMGLVLEQIRRLEDMVSDLTAFAQPAVVFPRPENVAALVARSVAAIESAPSMAGVDTVVDVEPGLTALADPERLSRALTIVLENAGHAVSGRGTIRVDAVREDRAVVIGVLDSGPGVPSERSEDVFRPFFTTKHRGSGLGLAIARRILEAHGGTLRLDPEVAAGARFVLRLPAVPGRGGRERT